MPIVFLINFFLYSSCFQLKIRKTSRSETRQKAHSSCQLIQIHGERLRLRLRFTQIQIQIEIEIVTMRACMAVAVAGNACETRIPPSRGGLHDVDESINDMTWKEEHQKNLNLFRVAPNSKEPPRPHRISFKRKIISPL